MKRLLLCVLLLAATALGQVTGDPNTGGGTVLVKGQSPVPQTLAIVPTYNGLVPASTVLVRMALIAPTAIPANCADVSHSTFLVAETAPAADATFTIQRCTNSSNTSWSCSNIGSAIIRAGKVSSVTSDVTCTATTFNAGDLVKVISPSSQDSTMSNVGGAIYATR